jgi:hypothetical protein
MTPASGAAAAAERSYRQCSEFVRPSMDWICPAGLWHSEAPMDWTSSPSSPSVQSVRPVRPSNGPIMDQEPKLNHVYHRQNEFNLLGLVIVASQIPKRVCP